MTSIFRSICADSDRYAEYCAFMRAIHAVPTDDTARLVFADWIEEKGDGDYAGLIRLQCQKARYTASDPARRAIAAKENALFAAHPEWLEYPAELNGITTAEVKNAYKRGLLELDLHVPVTDFMEDPAAFFERVPGLHRMRFTAPERTPCDIMPLQDRRELELLTAISFEGMRVGDLGVTALVDSGRLQKLKRLSVKNCNLHNKTFRAIVTSDQLPMLRELDYGANALGGDRSDPLGPPSSLSYLTDGGVHLLPLTTLRLSSLTRTTPADWQRIMRSGLMDSVELVELSGNPGSFDAFMGSTHCNRVRGLIMHGAELGDHAAAALAGSARLAQLSLLELDDNHLGEANIGLIVGAPGVSNIRQLSLNNVVSTSHPGVMGTAASAAGDEVARVVSQSPHLLQLRQLELARNGITDTGASHLASGEHFASLGALNLAQNAIEREGLRQLAGASIRLRGLMRLDVYDNPGLRTLNTDPHMTWGADAALPRIDYSNLPKAMGATGAAALIMALRLPNLRQLNVINPGDEHRYFYQLPPPEFAQHVMQQINRQLQSLRGGGLV